MIKINLAKRKTSVIAKESSSNQLISGLMNMDALKQFPFTQMMIALIAYFGSSYGVKYYKDGVMTQLKGELLQVQERRTALEKELVSFKRLEKVKERLEADEKLIKGKILAINELIGGRSTGVKLISYVSQSMNDNENLRNIWLTDLSFKGELVKVVGQSLDQNLVSELIENLKKIPLLHSINMESLKQVKLNTDEVSEFSLTALKRDGVK